MPRNPNRKRIPLCYGSAEERLFQRTEPEPNSGCLLWMGAEVGRNQYGKIWYKGVGYQAHRFSWIMHNGPIPDGLLVCHHCDTPACVNPDHLYLADQKTNVQHSLDRDRWQRGERHFKARLTEEQVLAIRADTRSIAAIARAYNVSTGTIRAVLTRFTWKHI